MKTHTEKILEEIKAYINNMSQCREENRVYQVCEYKLKLAEAQLKEAERHDLIMKKIKEEVCKRYIKSPSKMRILEFINKIDQEEE